MSFLTNDKGFFQQGKSFGGKGIEGMLSGLGGKGKSCNKGLLNMDEPDNSMFNANPEGGQAYVKMLQEGLIPNQNMQPGEYDDEGMPILGSPFKKMNGGLLR
jgi:hypothetical protein